MRKDRGNNLILPTCGMRGWLRPWVLAIYFEWGGGQSASRLSTYACSLEAGIARRKCLLPTNILHMMGLKYTILFPFPSNHIPSFPTIRGDHKGDILVNKMWNESQLCSPYFWFILLLPPKCKVNTQQQVCWKMRPISLTPFIGTFFTPSGMTSQHFELHFFKICLKEFPLPYFDSARKMHSKVCK